MKGEDLGRPIRRSVVDDDEFPILISLIDRRSESLFEERLAVADGHDDRYPRLLRLHSATPAGRMTIPILKNLVAFIGDAARPL
jgi:hypothetical protein